MILGNSTRNSWYQVDPFFNTKQHPPNRLVWNRLIRNISALQLPRLAYLFERAGLWAVEDNATKELMVRFYENLKRKMSKTEALRQAKLQQIDRHPFFWSPFILIGDGQ